MLRRIQERKEKKKKFWMSTILVFLMVMSMMGVLLYNRGGENNGDTISYNGHTFSIQNNLFVTKIGEKQESFSFLPQQVENIQRPQNIREKLQRPMIYLVFDPQNKKDNLAFIDLIRNEFETKLTPIIESGVTTETETYVLPHITCENATITTPVFYFNVSNETSIKKEGDCIVINGQTVEFVKIRDLLMYINYGIIDG